jgi:hypothetical protein
VDLDGVVGLDAEDWAIQALTDEPPSARLDVSGASTYATPRAVLELAAVAEDDWDLSDLSVEARVVSPAGAMEVTSLPGLEWPPAPRLTDEIPPEMPAKGDVSTTLRLADLPGAVPGATLTLASVAHDRRPAEGRSAPRKLAIVSQEEFLVRFEAEMARALADLRRVYSLQETAQQRLAGLTSASKRVAESLATVARDQASVRRQLVEGPQSIVERARQLIGVLAANGLAQSEAGRRLDEVTASLAALETSLLPGLAADTASVAREVSLDGAAFRPARLAEIQGRQQTVLDALGPLVGALQGWELLQQLAAQLAAVAEEQRVMSGASTELAPTMLGRSRDELSAVEMGQLDHRMSEQRRLAKRFALLEQRLAALSGELPTSDSALLARLEAALAQAAGFAIGPNMQQAATDLEANRPARAADTQRQVAANIDALVDTLRGAAPAAPDSAVKSLAELQARQAALAAELAAANPQQLAALAQRQAALQQSLRAMSSSLSSSAAQAAAAASEAMSAAANAARAGQSRPAARAAQRAAEQLQVAANSQTPPVANDDPAAKLRERTLQLRDAQQRLFDRTRSADSVSAVPLANDQAQLRGQVDGLSQASGKVRVVQYALSQVSAAMARAVDLLERANAGPATQQAQAEAIERLTQLANSLEREPPPPEDQKPQTPPKPNGPGQQGNPPPPPGDPLLLAELKLVRQWQQTILERFAELAGDEAAALSDLREEQSRLADLAEEVAQRAAQAASAPPPASQESGDEQ